MCSIKFSGSKNSNIEEFRTSYFSSFAYQILVTVSSVDRVQDAVVYDTNIFSSSGLAFDPRPTRLFITSVITIVDTDQTVVV